MLHTASESAEEWPHAACGREGGFCRLPPRDCAVRGGGRGRRRQAPPPPSPHTHAPTPARGSAEHVPLEAENGGNRQRQRQREAQRGRSGRPGRRCGGLLRTTDGSLDAPHCGGSGTCASRPNMCRQHARHPVRRRHPGSPRPLPRTHTRWRRIFGAQRACIVSGCVRCNDVPKSRQWGLTRSCGKFRHKVRRKAP